MEGNAKGQIGDHALDCRALAMPHPLPSTCFGFAVATLPWFFSGCQQPLLTQEELKGESTEPAYSGNCQSCHDYPLHDVHHEFHVFLKAWYTRAARNYANCRDCHARSILGDTIWVQDTTFHDPNTSETWFSWFYPERERSVGLDLVRVRTLAYLRALPVEPDPEPIRLQPFREWRTGPAHLNGVVDVDFDEWISDSVSFGRKATFDPKYQTCSAILCHADAKPYRWMAPSKGLGPLRGVSPESP
jgi:hypothetical protein